MRHILWLFRFYDKKLLAITISFIAYSSSVKVYNSAFRIAWTLELLFIRTISYFHIYF